MRRGTRSSWPTRTTIRARSGAIATACSSDRSTVSSWPLGAAERPSAIVAANDLVALGVLDAADAMGLSCPEDLSVIGFNDMAFIDRLRPPLTSVRIDEYLLGLQASKLLLSVIEDPSAKRKTVMLSPELVVRGSTGPPTLD